VGKFVGIKHGGLTKQRYHKGCSVLCIILHTCSWCNNLGVEEGAGKGVCLFARGALLGQINFCWDK